MYLGQLPYEVIIRKKIKNRITSLQIAKTCQKVLPKKELKSNVVFQNELRSINKMIRHEIQN